MPDIDHRSQTQPLHVVYGGANLFSAQTVAKLSSIASDVFEEYCPVAEKLVVTFGLDPGIAEIVRDRAATRLASRAIEDYRVDFEDGYGIRPDEEEDAHAVAAAEETAKAMNHGSLPPHFGIRIKSFSPEARDRATRTLDLYLTRMVETAGKLPENFVVTLPKVESADEVTSLVDLLDGHGSRLGIDADLLKIELMAETPLSLIASDGRFALPGIVEAGRGRVSAVHFGAYDYTASLGLTSSSQQLFHQSCDFARNIMQVSLASTGVWLSDGATNIMPIAIHRGLDLTAEHRADNQRSIELGLRLHHDNVRRSLANGFHQGWDLHPAQIPARLVAVYSFYLEEYQQMAARLRSFVDRATKASMVGCTFDDAATGEGLLNFFRRGLACGVFGDSDLQATGLSLGEVLSSFREIVKSRT